MFITRLKRRLFSHPHLSRFLLLLIPVILVLGFIKLVIYPSLPSVISSGAKIILNRDPDVLKNAAGRTNILLLGIGGGNHEGPNLTDTMIVASIQTKFESDAVVVSPIELISIPRDIYLDSIQGKINSAYQIGLDQGAGLVLAKQAASQVTGLPIHYAAVVNFSVFEKVIDTLGGIDVNVPDVLDDYMYPIDGQETNPCGLSPVPLVTDELSAVKIFPCRYEHLHFDPGLQHMDGATALKYVRSRHAEGSEGSDFARSRRQQLVIKAIKDKVFSGSNFLDLSKDLTLYNQIKTSIDTDFDFSQPKALLALGLKYRNATFKNIVLDETLFTNPPEDQRGWILLPNNNSWDQIHQLIASQSGSLK